MKFLSSPATVTAQEGVHPQRAGAAFWVDVSANPSRCQTDGAANELSSMNRPREELRGLKGPNVLLRDEEAAMGTVNKCSQRSRIVDSYCE